MGGDSTHSSEDGWNHGFEFSQFSRSVMSNNLQHHGLQHTKLPCHQLPEFAHVHWCHQTISSSIVPFSSCLHSFSVSGSFLMSQLITSGGQSIGASTLASVLPMNIQDQFPVWLIGLISLQSRDSQESSPTPQFKSINSLALSFLYGPTLTSIPDYWKNYSFD